MSVNVLGGTGLLNNKWAIEIEKELTRAKDSKCLKFTLETKVPILVTFSL
jgi:hypothetical protein